MFVGLIIIAMLSGLLAAGLALFMSLPVWAALLAYSVTGSVALVLAALAMGGPRRSDAAPHPSQVAQAASGK